MKLLHRPMLAAIASCGLAFHTSIATAQDQKPQSADSPRKLVEQFPAGQFAPMFDGKSLEGWRVIDKNDFERRGEVVVEDGAIVIGAGKPASGVAWKGPLPRVNYELRLEAKRIEGSDFFCGVTFPVGDDYLSLIVGGWGGGVTGVSNLDGMSAVENETTGYVEFKQDQWYAVRLRVTDDRVQAWVDRDRIVDIATKGRKLSIWWEQEPARPLGIVSWDTKAAIRNVRMKRLDGVAVKPTPEQLPLLKTFRDEFIQITPGEGKFPKRFTMGSDKGGPHEQPAHLVTLEYDFSVAKYEVPQNLWQAVMGENPSRWKGPRNSVEMLSYADAVQFCERVSELLRGAELIGPTQVVRLPSEAEWEYVARAGTETAYSFGDEAARLDEYGWHTGNAAGNDPPVGAKKPNPWGLYDIHGYLWEWCADPAHADYKGAPTDGSVWAEGGDSKRRVIRGGSWKDRPESLTSFCRSVKFRGIEPGSIVEVVGGVDANLKDDAVGLRCVLAEE